MTFNPTRYTLFVTTTIQVPIDLKNYATPNGIPSIEAFCNKALKNPEILVALGVRGTPTQIIPHRTIYKNFPVKE